MLRLPCLALGCGGGSSLAGRALAALGPFVRREAFLVSTGVVSWGEMVDKTQINTVLLTARFNALAAVLFGAGS